MFCAKKCVLLRTGWLPGALIGLGACVFMMHISIWYLKPYRQNKKNEKKMDENMCKNILHSAWD